MHVNIRWITSLAATMVLTASPGAAQTEPLHASFSPSSISAAPDLARDLLDEDQPSEDQDSIPSFLKDVAGDIWRFFSGRETYLALGLGMTGSLSVRPLDADAPSGRLNSSSPGHEDIGLAAWSAPGELLGGSVVQIGGALATYGMGHWVGKPGVAKLGRDLTRAQLLTGGFTHLLKLTIHRTRPDGSSHNSFPSAHTSGTFASATVLNRHYGWKVGIPAYGVASYVAASRVADGKHYLSDVVFGVAIGLAGARRVTFDRGGTTIEVSPLAVSGGVGVQVSVYKRPIRSAAAGAF